MEKMTIAQNVATKLTEEMGFARAEAQEVIKNNGIIITGVTLSRGENLSPMIYIDQYIDGLDEDTTDMDTVVSYVTNKCVEVYEGYKRPEFDTNAFMDFEQVKNKLSVETLNAKANKEMLDRNGVVYRQVSDLVIIPTVIVSVDEMETGFIKIMKNYIEMWGVDESELIDMAIENYKATETPIITGMREQLINMGMPEEIIPEGPEMVIVTVPSGIYGAYHLLNVELLEQIKAERFMGEEIVMIPSSVHEFLVIPKNKADMEEINNMIRGINEIQLAPGEVLSDHAYILEDGKVIAYA